MPIKLSSAPPNTERARMAFGLAGHCIGANSPLPEARLALAVDLAEHDIEGAQNGGDVGQHVAAVQKVHGLEMRKARRPDLAAVGPIAAIRDQVDPELTLGRLDGSVDLAGGNMEALGVELEVVDQRFHGAFH